MENSVQRLANEAVRLSLELYGSGILAVIEDHPD